MFLSELRRMDAFSGMARIELPESRYFQSITLAVFPYMPLRKQQYNPKLLRSGPPTFFYHAATSPSALATGNSSFGEGMDLVT